MQADVLEAFESIGARVAKDRFAPDFSLDIVRQEAGEAYQFGFPHTGSVVLQVTNAEPRVKHLVLDVMADRGPSGRYLCGLDESHWFIAGVRFGHRTHTVRGAMESLQ